MSRVSAPQAGKYLLEVRRGPQPLPFIRMKFTMPAGTRRTIFAPGLPVAQYLLHTSGEAKIDIVSPADARASLRRVTNIEASIRARRPKDRAFTISVDDEDLGA